MTCNPKSDLISLVREYADVIRNGRTPLDVHNHLCAEAKELMKEMGRFRFLRHFGNFGRRLEDTLNQKFPVRHGPDNVEGEAIDLLTCALDLIFIHNPSMTNEQIMEITEKKLQKWKRRYGDSIKGDRSIL